MDMTPATRPDPAGRDAPPPAALPLSVPPSAPSSVPPSAPVAAVAGPSAPRRPEPLEQFLAAPGDHLKRGPIAVILIEDGTEIEATLAHHLKLGFRKILALSPEPLEPVAPLGAAGNKVLNLIHDTRARDALPRAVNAVIAAAPPDSWIYYGYNAEFLFYPFSETRGVGEMLAFHAEERRRAMLTYVVDLYAPDLAQNPDAVSMDQAMFDRSGYYALGRPDRQGGFRERQLDFYGGLRWRFEEHLPPDRRRIDRIALFRTEKGLQLLPDHRLSVEEYNTYACPWHNNLTAAVASFRVAKALARNPGSREHLRDFTWRNSVRFRWESSQLMELGLMEPGQWF